MHYSTRKHDLATTSTICYVVQIEIVLILQGLTVTCSLSVQPFLSDDASIFKKHEHSHVGGSFLLFLDK